MKKFIILFILLATFLASCAPAATEVPPTATLAPTATATSTPMPDALWISPAAPTPLLAAAQTWDIPHTSDPARATVQLDASQPADSGNPNRVVWIYALVAPFPTVTDDVSSADILNAWRGAPTGPFAGSPLWMSDSTLAAFTALLGAPAAGAVRTASADQLSAEAWKVMPSWAIIPFEEVEPRWKVLSVDGQSPIRKSFDAAAYPLQVSFVLRSSVPTSFALPATNRDASKLATVILTGTTALVDATAFTMEQKGVTYPGLLIRDWMREADITHISNEVAFDKDCPFPNPGNRNLAILCSRPNYMDLLLDVGMDVVELTGDHFNNRGIAAMRSTLQMYRDAGIPYYGGGENIADSVKPIFMERNGNRFMFIGCNMKQNYPHAGTFEPGAAPCDFNYMTGEIAKAREAGILPIVTIQDYEYYSPEIRLGQMDTFHKMADAGAVIVSGSQGHYPQVMEFHNKVFLHYALGNLFYTQMSYTLLDGSVTEKTRWEFLDRHVFYDGRYIGTELLTAMLEEYSSPRPMTANERAQFLQEYFFYSGWIGLTPTPVPSPTLTLTPLAIPTIVGTPRLPPLPTPTGTPPP
jgi:poly-gamma-glutamate synthesis protein (capsule biosynthesis protein)